MPFDAMLSATIYLDVFLLCHGEERKESSTMPAALGEHVLFEAESFCLHALVETIGENGVTVELIALPPHSTIYNGKILCLAVGHSAEFTFHGETESGEGETVRVCVSVRGA